MLLGLYTVLGCAAATPRAETEAPEVYLSNITPLEAGLFEQTMQVDLRILNPNNFDLEVTGIDVQLDVNDVRLTRAVSNHTVTIPRLGESSLSIVARTTSVDIIRHIVASQQRQEMGYEIRGRVYLGNASVESVSFKHAGTFGP